MYGMTFLQCAIASTRIGRPIELAPIILERIIQLTTEVGDLVCDPFAGGGVTAYVAERLHRRWIVGDINDCGAVKERLISWDEGYHPEWKTNSKRISETGSLSDRTSRALPLLDTLTS